MVSERSEHGAGPSLSRFFRSSSRALAVVGAWRVKTSRLSPRFFPFFFRPCAVPDAIGFAAADDEDATWVSTWKTSVHGNREAF